jgi:hypothetical protein
MTNKGRRERGPSATTLPVVDRQNAFKNDWSSCKGEPRQRRSAQQLDREAFDRSKVPVVIAGVRSK